MATRNSNWELGESEADSLAAGIQKVARHYELPDIASETKDWIALLIIAGSIYGPRFAANAMNKRTPPVADEPASDEVPVSPNVIGLHS